MDRLKTTEEYVISVLERNQRARSDDFILYGGVLKEMDINLHMELAQFLAFAKVMFNAPSFETVTRCRRHIQELRPELRGKNEDKRFEAQEEFKMYNRSGIGDE